MKNGKRITDAELVAACNMSLEEMRAEANYKATVGPITVVLRRKWDERINADAAEPLPYPYFEGYLRQFSPQLLEQAIKRASRRREDIRNMDGYFKGVVHDLRRSEMKKAKKLKPETGL